MQGGRQISFPLIHFIEEEELLISAINSKIVALSEIWFSGNLKKVKVLNVSNCPLLGSILEEDIGQFPNLKDIRTNSSCKNLTLPPLSECDSLQRIKQVQYFGFLFLIFY